MKVSIILFPETKVAAITHIGPPSREYETVRKLIAWKLENRLLDPTRHRSNGLHYTDPRKSNPLEYRMESCLSIDRGVGPNAYGIYEKTIPCLRCALARDVGSRSNNRAARYLLEEWLPASNEQMSGFPMIFHYVNVGPSVKESEAITDVYMPIK